MEDSVQGGNYWYRGTQTHGHLKEYMVFQEQQPIQEAGAVGGSDTREVWVSGCEGLSRVKEQRDFCHQVCICKVFVMMAYGRQTGVESLDER